MEGVVRTCRKLTPVLLAAVLLKAFVSLSCDSSLSLSSMWEQIPKMLMKMRVIVYDHAHLHQHLRDLYCDLASCLRRTVLQNC